MRRLLSIDPGIKALGLCYWRDGVLVGADCSIARGRGSLGTIVNYHTAYLRAGSWAPPSDVAVELMRFRKDDPRSYPNDLIDVQAVGMAVAGMWQGSVALYSPGEWKRNLPKSVHQKRFRAALSSDEEQTLAAAISCCPKGHHKEILDALGIGLFHLGRTNKAGGSRT